MKREETALSYGEGRKEGRKDDGERGGRGAVVKRTGGKGAIEQESMHAATGSSKESSQVSVGASADVGELCASS